MSDFTVKLKHVHDIFTNYNAQLINEHKINNDIIDKNGLSVLKENNWTRHDKTQPRTPKSYFQISQGFNIQDKTYCIIAKKTVYLRNKSLNIYVAFVEVKYSEKKVWSNRMSSITCEFKRLKEPQIICCHENTLLNKLGSNGYEWVSAMNTT